MPLPKLVARSILTFVSLAGLTVGLVWMFLAMRAVMRIGGSCASGGPYVISRQCPDDVPALMLGGLFGGLFCLVVYAVKGLPFGPRLAMLAWPGLFLTLGWNFLEFGFDPPEEEGPGYAWLVCGVLFVLMGGFPLVGLLLPAGLRATFWTDEKPKTPPAPLYQGPAAGQPAAATESRVSGRIDTGDRGGQPDNLADSLERMTALHAAGALSDEEHTAAKRRLLGLDTTGDTEPGEA